MWNPYPQVFSFRKGLVAGTTGQLLDPRRGRVRHSNGIITSVSVLVWEMRIRREARDEVEETSWRPGITGVGMVWGSVAPPSELDPSCLGHLRQR